MKVVALTRTSSIGPSTRYRFEQYRPLLAGRGIDVRQRPLFGPAWFRILELPPGPARALCKALYSSSRLLVRLGQLAAARWSGADVIHVEQQLFPYLPAAVEFLLWPRGRPTILEFDDAIYLTPGHRRKLEGLCARADLVIVGNRFLAEFARPHARRLRVIPTTIDLAAYADARRLAAGRRAQRADRGSGWRFTVGWIGLRYNLPYLEQLREPLVQLAREAPCELRVISSAAPEPSPAWGDVRIVHRPWSAAGEAAEIAACDVGVMPLPDDEWARGKCGLKLLQYMAAGVPAVASPVGINADLIRPGESGLLATGVDGWTDALRRLRDDPALAQRLGEAGPRTVGRDFSAAGGAEMLAESYGLAGLPAEGDGEPSEP